MNLDKNGRPKIGKDSSAYIDGTRSHVVRTINPFINLIEDWHFKYVEKDNQWIFTKRAIQSGRVKQLLFDLKKER